jgi:hypothetical protein
MRTAYIYAMPVPIEVFVDPPQVLESAGTIQALVCFEPQLDCANHSKMESSVPDREFLEVDRDQPEFLYQLQ